MPVSSICEVCKKVFQHKKYNKGKTRRFCSNACYYKIHKIPQGFCKNCNKLFKQRALHGRQKFCTRACRWEFERKKTPTTVCEHCGVKFSRSASIFKYNAVRFCSVSCAEASGYRKTTPRYTVPRKITKCGNCGADFEHRSTERRTYCSQACAGTLGRVRNPSYRRLKTKGWVRLRLEIIERDRCCRVCGSTKRLAVHHVIPWRISHDDSPSNLVTLCNSCHPRVESGLVSL
ncbi:MAG: HNH endonuclease [Anaerolineales bacterium]|nr:MAG: HNH endonuclease [Anaerolineales bacterium]